MRPGTEADVRGLLTKLIRRNSRKKKLIHPPVAQQKLLSLPKSLACPIYTSSERAYPGNRLRAVGKLGQEEAMKTPAGDDADSSAPAATMPTPPRRR
jgi:hypothetical protein